jgi:hypothetical protein
MDKSTIIIRRMNVVMYFVMATQSIPLSIDAFMRRKRESFMKILRV